jgi:hypothetical protein
MSKLVEREVTVSCSVNNGRGYLYTGEFGEFPKRNYVVHVNNEVGELAMNGASLSRPLLLTVETGSHRQLSAIAEKVYDGPFRIFGDGYMAYGDQAGAVNTFWFGLTEGLYHMEVQVTGRKEAYERDNAESDRLLMMSEEEWQEDLAEAYDDSDIEPIEHWWINFTKKIDDVDDDIILPQHIPMTIERALWAALPGTNVGSTDTTYLDESEEYLARYVAQHHPLSVFLTGPLETIRAKQEAAKQPPPPQPQAPRGARPGDFGVVVDEQGKIIGYTGNAVLDVKAEDTSTQT